ncbi:hypothetical protein CBM2598_U10005 [Cupriavidus taiwanensis]|uniref:Uncharacterized protein n=1 Tax=Cupriavidus taiwanensis TaxID=164546 RepID=A0A7Z7JIK0_9BURK|nr:hypothetical protein CBM2597_U10036 [Cupriavidus taiwanensis]SOZ96175.1 hypothetical protein CBM2598_U10005 [Cupriavidus taiwanensis]SPC25542.1 hypothetical protein CBM2594_U10043 [Cupriavidus taiwanensis]
MRSWRLIKQRCGEGGLEWYGPFGIMFGASGGAALTFVGGFRCRADLGLADVGQAMRQI